MPKPKGGLTGTQLEIMEAVWSAGSGGISVAEIWHLLAAQRAVARTTVLTMVARLEKRGWLVRKEAGRAFRYFATRGKAQASSGLAARFVDEFFGGSASELVMSLLGSKRIQPEELEKVRKLLDEAEGKIKK